MAILAPVDCCKSEHNTWSSFAERRGSTQGDGITAVSGWPGLSQSTHWANLKQLDCGLSRAWVARNVLRATGVPWA